MSLTPTRPEKEFKVGAVRAAIWTNIRQAPGGQDFKSHKVLIERVYRDNQGNFQNTGSLDLNDIPKAILALKKAYEYLTLKDEKRSESEKPYPNLQVSPRVP